MKITHLRFSNLRSLFLMLLVLVLVCSIAPINAHAGTTQSTVITRLNELRALAQRGLYFTTTGKACTNASSSECNVNNVIASGSAFRANSGLTKWPSSSISMTHGRYNNPFTTVYNGYSCVGFANFAGWYLFADSASSSVSYYRLMDCQYKDVYRYAVPGDIIASSTHSMIYISGNSSKITVLDCNWSNDCKIKEHTRNADTTKVTISRAYGYDLSDDEKFIQIAAEEGPDGHMYYLYSARCLWTAAEAYVANHFGSDYHLVTINSAEEQTFVANMVKTWNGAGHGGMAWTGAHYVNGSWVWSNGEAWSYSNFDSSSSGSTSNAYGAIIGSTGERGNYSYTAGKWYAKSALEQWAMPGFVVECESNSYSGSLGDVMSWEFVNGVLSITGTGRMDSFSPGNSPWYGFRDQITTVEIGSGVINIGGNAFCDLINLTCVSMPEIDEINDCAFRGCASLESVTINAGYVGRYAFADCNIMADVTITDECVVIEDYAFAYDYELQEVYIPDSVQQIGSYAFGPTYDGGMNPHLVIYCGEGSAAQQYAIDYDISYVITSGPTNPEILASGTIGNLTWEVHYDPTIEYDTQLWFTGSGDLYYSNQAPWSEYIDSIDCVIMEFADITYIGSNTFRNHSNSKIFALSENLQSMGQRVFENCASLEYIALPEHLNSIGAYAFSGCSSLEYITIPAELQEIQAHAFENCTGLVYAEITAASPVISDTAFDGCTNMSIYCVKGNTAHQFAEEHGIPFVCIDCYFDSDFNPPASLKAIESEAFRGIPAIAVRLPDGISSIGNLAFAYCPNLINIYIPASCVTISNNAFEGCENLCIHAPEGSYAEYYANKHGFSFEVLNLD